MTHLINRRRMSANYIVGKKAKLMIKNHFFAHFQILMKMGTDIYCIFNISDISHSIKLIVVAFIFRIFELAIYYNPIC